MIEPSWSYTNITFCRYPVSSKHISLIQRVVGRRSQPSTQPRRIEQIPVGFSGDSVFIPHPTHIRTDITKYHRIWSNPANGGFKSVPVIHHFFSIRPLSIGTIPPEFKEGSVITNHFFHHIYKNLIVRCS